MSNTSGTNINRIFIWIIVVILVLFLLCCVTPYTYIKFFVPTPTPTLFPTSIPSPTEDPTLTYVTNLGEISSQEASMLNIIAATVKNASQSDMDNPAWKNDVYSKFDNLIALANNAANLTPPSGWQPVQVDLDNVHNEFVLAKAALTDYYENKNQNAIQEFGKHLELANSYIGAVSSFVRSKGY